MTINSYVVEIQVIVPTDAGREPREMRLPIGEYPRRQAEFFARQLSRVVPDGVVTLWQHRARVHGEKTAPPRVISRLRDGSTLPKTQTA